MQLTPQRKRIAVSTEGEPSGVMEFLNGLRDGLPTETYSLMPLPGGPENTLSGLGKSGGLAGLVGSFAGQPPRTTSLSMVNLEFLSRIESLHGVAPDWQTAGQTASAHFKEVGLSHVAFVGARGQYAAREMLKGFTHTAELNNIACHEAPALPLAQTNWLKALPKPIGLFCPSPATAARLIMTAQELGLAIPEELAVMTTGDTALASLQTGLELTTLPLPFRAMGKAVAEILLGQSSTPVHRVIPMASLQMRASTQRKSARRAAFEHLLEVLPNELNTSISVEVLADRAGMSRRAFEVAFRERTGQSPAIYLRSLRMDKAKSLLKDTELAVSEVGSRCGYPEPHVFSATFKRETGTSPLGWRYANSSLSK